jgi:hypothetical protein
LAFFAAFFLCYVKSFLFNTNNIYVNGTSRMAPIDDKYYIINTPKDHHQFLKHVAIKKGLSKRARAFIFVIHDSYNHTRHDAFPGDEIILKGMDTWLEKIATNSDFQKGRAEAFNAGLFVFLPREGPNKQNIYRLLKFWEPTDKGDYRPSEHPYIGRQKQGRPKIERRPAKAVNIKPAPQLITPTSFGFPKAQQELAAALADPTIDVEWRTAFEIAQKFNLDKRDFEILEKAVADNEIAKRASQESTSQT